MAVSNSHCCRFENKSVSHSIGVRSRPWRKGSGMRRDPGAISRVLPKRFEAEALGLEPDDQRFQVGRCPWILARPDAQVREQNVSRLDLVERLLQQLFVAELLARQLV